MHKFYFYALLLCSLSMYPRSDDTGDLQATERTASPGLSKDNPGNTIRVQPANPANPYDFAGALHNSILEGYFQLRIRKRQ